MFLVMERSPPLLKFEVLRVLDLEDCSKTEDVDIGNLIHLRYLSTTNISKIPKEIGNLQGLQTLNLRRASISQQPKEITSLKQLIQLTMPYNVQLPKGISKMEALEELSHFSIGRNSPELLLELGNITKL
jgi:Leucine-rich repeat (LRR) protein